MTKKNSPFRLFFGCTKKPILFNYSTVFPSARSYRTPMVGDAENQVLVVFVVFCYTVFNFLRLGGVSPMTDTKIEEQDYVSVGTIPPPALGPAKRAATEGN